MTRRTALASIAGAVLSRAQAPAIVTSKNRVVTPHCILASEQEEGPYYVDQRIVRSDITEGRAGIPLHLEMTVIDVRDCSPLGNAAVSIWHCDAMGVYSGFTAQGSGGGPPMGGPGGPPPGGGFGPPGFGNGGPPPGPPPHHGASDKTRYLRGVQTTDQAGAVNFLTIYPGWYMGRSIHIHLKVIAGGHVCHTGQLFFPEDLTDRIAKLKPYSAHSIDRTRQDEDQVFTGQHGADFVLTPVQISARQIADGFRARAIMGVDPDAQPKIVGPGGPPPRA